MPIFISYSHENKEFVDRLAAHLVKHKVHVWVDHWELHVGDSIINKIQDTIQGASALLVVVSKASVSSEWCKKELTSGLLRELEEKKVVVLPVLLENCDIPLFLREKHYADFRTNFNNGFKAILESIARVTSTERSRIYTPEFHIDWGIDWGYIGDRLLLRVTLVEQAKEYPFTVLTEIEILANESATARYKEIESLGLDWFGRVVILGLIADVAEDRDLTVLLENQLPKQQNILINDKKSDKEYDVVITTRWLGEDTGRDLVVHVSDQLLLIRQYIREVGRELTVEELRRLNIPIIY